MLSLCLVSALLFFATPLVGAYAIATGKDGGFAYSFTDSRSIFFGDKNETEVSYDKNSHTIFITSKGIIDQDLALDTEDKVFEEKGEQNAIILNIVFTNLGDNNVIVGVADKTLLGLTQMVNIKGSVIYTQDSTPFYNQVVKQGQTISFSIKYVLIDCGLDAFADVPLGLNIATV